MRTKHKASLSVLTVLLIAASVTPPVAARQAANVTEKNWLIAGPFPAVGENALFADYLSSAGREADARAGEVASGDSAGGAVRWQPSNPDQDGIIDFKKIWPGQRRAVAYAYTELDSPSQRFLVATVGSGNNIQVSLNGEIVYESRLSRKAEPDKDTLVLRLRQGINPLFVKVEGGQGGWGLQWKTHRPEGRLFINRSATVVPDFRVGERIGAWGQMEVANVSAAPLTDVVVEVVGGDLVLPSRSEAVTLAPGEVQRIPFWVAGKATVPDAGAGQLRLRGAADGEEQMFEIAPRVRKRTEYFVTTYRSFVDGSVQPYSVLLPTSYDPHETYPLIVLLHGAHVTDWGQNIISYAPKEWAIQVAVHDRGNNRYRDIGDVDLEEVLADVKRRYKINSDRMYLSSHSMGGYGTWLQAARHPDRWASFSPQAGYADYFLSHPAMREGRDITKQQFQKQLLEHWSPLIFAENLLHVPAYVVHGAKDDNVVVTHSRKMAARLKELSYTYVYDENPEGGHWWGPRGTDYGVEVVDKPPIWKFFQKHSRRVRAPRRVIYTTDSLRFREVYWVAIDELDSANEIARIEAEVTAPDTVSVRLSNITQFTLRLDDSPVVVGRPVTVSVNGRAAYSAPLPPSSRLTLRREADGRYVQLFSNSDLHIAGRSPEAERLDNVAAELDKAGHVARFLMRAEGPLKKNPRIYGPVSDAFNTPFLFVVGTIGRSSKAVEMRESSRRAAVAQARQWMAQANGIVRIKTDVEVTREDIASHNLILFGDAGTNALIAQINDELPIKLTAKGLMVGGRQVAGDDLGAVFVLPNPLNRERYA
ncbi:MAG: prolyl oligopeptidase family serine peptidase, partial [Acidobacteriota bacterium]|nr:prolyl oligopeptidase family serine peptidase [Acidobacteriota bacterium]